MTVQDYLQVLREQRATALQGAQQRSRPVSTCSGSCGRTSSSLLWATRARSSS